MVGEGEEDSLEMVGEGEEDSRDRCVGPRLQSPGFRVLMITNIYSYLY